MGSEIATKIFPAGVDPVGKDISVAGLKLQVAGVLKSKGTSIGAGDQICFMPVTTARQYFSRPNMNFNITVMPINPVNLDVLAGQAEAAFRVVRNLDPRDESDFNVVKSDTILNMLLKNIRYVTLAATLIGIVTLFGAAVGLMNIMLVSVTERTREIGVRKAVGAKPITIKYQFLFESITDRTIWRHLRNYPRHPDRQRCFIHAQVKLRGSVVLGYNRYCGMFYCRSCFGLCSCR